MKKQLTTFQQQVFDYMVDFFKVNDQLPPVQSICDEFHRYPNQISEMHASFEKKGLIERNAVGKFRFSRAKP